jgi:maltose O-acetyltransferase
VGAEADHYLNSDFDPRAFSTQPRARRGGRLRAWRSTFVREWLVNPIASSALPASLRLAVLRRYGLELGRCRIAPGSWFGGSDIAIGDDAFINRGCVFDNSARIDIGRGAGIGMGCMFVTSSHEVGPPEHRVGGFRSAPITIGEGAWLANRVTVLCGAVVGPGCVIAAGSLVPEGAVCEAHSFYAGVPARKVRALD